jgi:small-conductance mechanosensitive channel
MINLPNTGYLDQIQAWINSILPQVPGAVIALLFGILLIRIIAWVAELLLSLLSLPRGLRGILLSLTNALLWAFLIIAVLSALKLNNIAFAFSGGIAALGLALAAGGSTLAADILAGVFLARDPDFGVGDLVRAGESPTEGVVENMDMRRTRLRDKAGKLHVLPNSVIERKEWVVLATRRELKEREEERAKK